MPCLTPFLRVKLFSKTHKTFSTHPETTLKVFRRYTQPSSLRSRKFWGHTTHKQEDINEKLKKVRFVQTFLNKTAENVFSNPGWNWWVLWNIVQLPKRLKSRENVVKPRGKLQKDAFKRLPKIDFSSWSYISNPKIFILREQHGKITVILRGEMKIGVKNTK